VSLPDFRIPQGLDLLLLAMPISTLEPKIQLGVIDGLLKAAGLASAPITVALEYYAYLLTCDVGLDYASYSDVISERISPEWLFTDEDFQGHSPVAIETALGERSALYAKIKAVTPAFVTALATQVVASGAKVVGFSVAFSQSVASLVLAKRIKALAPDTIILFGGAGCTFHVGDAMLQSFPWVDAVWYGDAEAGLPSFLQALLVDPRATSPHASTRRANGTLCPAQGPAVAMGDQFVAPNYDEYFERLDRLRLGALRAVIYMPFEASRGCWWGAKQVCVFCSHNETMAYRRKPWALAVQEVRTLAINYRVLRFQAVDCILDFKDAHRFLAALKGLDVDLDLFLEVKSNIGLNDLIAIKQAGARYIQPGIESLSTPILKAMRKGVTAIQNVRFLKFCAWLGMSPIWNIIHGCTRDETGELEQMAKLIKNLTHLQPPRSNAVVVDLRRGSLLFDRPEHLGLINIKPLAIYGKLYPVEGQPLADLAFSFSYDHEDGHDVKAATAALNAVQAAWIADYPQTRGTLTYGRLGERIVITDLRPGRTARYEPDVYASRIYQRCLDIVAIDKLAQDPFLLAAGLGPADVETCVAFFEQKGLLMREGDLLLALAIPAYAPY
jgi:ribosomal peptide maturation radical SAM protein 1